MSKYSIAEHLLRDGREVLIDEPVAVVVEAVQRILVVPLERVLRIEDVRHAVAVVVGEARAVGRALPRLVDPGQKILGIRTELDLVDRGGDERVGVARRLPLDAADPEPAPRRGTRCCCRRATRPTGCRDQQSQSPKKPRFTRGEAAGRRCDTTRRTG